MKTKEQVLKYTQLCAFQHDDWQCVLDYCRERFGGGNIHKALKPVFQSDYQKFLDWIDNGYGRGDIVKYGNTIGMIKYAVGSNIVLMAYLSFDDDLIVMDLDASEDRISCATQEEIEKFSSLMHKSRMELSESLTIVEMYAPEDGDIVCVEYDNHKTTGIYMNQDGCDIYFYALVVDAHISARTTLPVASTILSKPYKSDMMNFQEALSDNHLGWSARSKRLYDIKYCRTDKGGRYWYISDKFTIMSANDMHTSSHDMRFKNHNYFTSFSQALYVLQQIKDLVTQTGPDE